MQPIEKLLQLLKREGTSLPPWMMPLGNEVIVYSSVRYMSSEALKKLRKDTDDDSEDDEDEDDSGSANSSSVSSSGSNASAGNGNYNPNEPRIPAGQPGGGQWTTGGATDTTPVPTMPLPQRAQVADAANDERCYNQCAHLLPSPSGDLQSSEYRQCYRQCKGYL